MKLELDQSERTVFPCGAHAASLFNVLYTILRFPRDGHGPESKGRSQFDWATSSPPPPTNQPLGILIPS